MAKLLSILIIGLLFESAGVVSLNGAVLRLAALAHAAASSALLGAAAWVAAAVAAAVSEAGATSPGDMGKVMAVLKPRLAGRADMTEVSKQVKAALAPK